MDSGAPGALGLNRWPLHGSVGGSHSSIQAASGTRFPFLPRYSATWKDLRYGSAGSGGQTGLQLQCVLLPECEVDFENQSGSATRHIPTAPTSASVSQQCPRK